MKGVFYARQNCGSVSRKGLPEPESRRAEASRSIELDFPRNVTKGTNGSVTRACLTGGNRFPARSTCGIIGNVRSDEKKEDARILVVEDDEDAREAMVALLQMKGYRAVPASNGKEALDYLRLARVPDLIILDLWMPVMDGWQFRTEQVKDPRLAEIPVIVVTALSDRADVDADEIITKPVDVEHLLATVSHYCRREPS
jgi:CheY-like chemotaxis protein